MMDMMGGMGWWMGRSLTGPAGDPAERELRRRYAAGEIDDEEYRLRLTGLRQQ